MSTKDAVVLASRTLATLLTVWALTNVTYLPNEISEVLRYAGNSVVSASIQHWQHYDLLTLSFNVVRIIGFSLTARWLYRGGPEVAAFLLPGSEESTQS